jgi:hypothetical protein
MSGRRIEQTSECLLIRSLSPNPFVSIVRFASRFVALLPEAITYNEETSKRAVGIAQKIETDFGRAELSDPLSSICDKLPKGRGAGQFFCVITDGEVANRDRVLELVRMNAVSNRCFTIALGSEVDVGLVQRIADSTGGRADFVSEDESWSVCLPITPRCVWTCLSYQLIFFRILPIILFSFVSRWFCCGFFFEYRDKYIINSSLDSRQSETIQKVHGDL